MLASQSPLNYSAFTLLETLAPSLGEPVVVSVSSQLFAALVAGLLLAFGLQFLITNLGIAVGVTAFQFRSRTQRQPELSSQLQPAPSQKSHVKSHLGTIAALAILGTINVVLFAACFLAIRFSQVQDALSGAIVGLIIWAAYFLILLWLSTSAASSLLSTVLGFTVTGIGGFVALIRNLLKRRNPSGLDEKALSAIRQQVEVTLDATDLKKTLEDYLEQLAPPQLDWSQVRTDLKALIQQPDLQPFQAYWQQLDRATLIDLMKQRSTFSDQEIDQIVDELEQLLQPLVNGQGERKTDTTDTRDVDNAGMQKGIKHGLQKALHNIKHPNESLNAALQQVDLEKIVTTTLQAQLEQFLVQQAGTALQDTATASVQRLKQPLAAARQQILTKISPSETQTPASEIQTQLESYLHHTSAKQLTPKRIERKLQKLLQATQMDATALPSLNEASLKTVLQHRKSLSQKQQRQILREIVRVWDEAITLDPLEHLDQLEAAPITDAFEQIEPPVDASTDTQSGQIQSEEQAQAALNALLDKVVSYFNPMTELSHASQHLKQSLLNWFTQQRLDHSLAQTWQTLWQQGSIEKLMQGLEQWQDSVSNWRDQLQQLDQAAPDWLQVQTLSEATQTYLQSQVEGLQQQMLSQIETLQQTVQAQIYHLKDQAQQRLEATRRAAARAAWWLFSIALTAAFSAATAGALASRLR